MRFKGLNDNRVTLQLGLSVGTLGKSRKEGRDLSDKVIERILNFYMDIDRIWLLTGEGPMLKAQTSQTQVVHGENIHGNTITQTNNNTAEIAVLEERVKSLESILSEKERLISEKERTIKLYEMMIEDRQRKATEHAKRTGDEL